MSIVRRPQWSPAAHDLERRRAKQAVPWDAVVRSEHREDHAQVGVLGERLPVVPRVTPDLLPAQSLDLSLEIEV
jgi:hypothetical protein